MGKFLKYCLAFVCIAANLSFSEAQPFSYVYIQGDKSVPFYVKMEGQMMPRYGKNFCILSELNTGVIHIEILFQQNVFPPQKFTVYVPENGFRGFLLDKRAQGFELYDLQEKKYLNPDDEAKKQ